MDSAVQDRLISHWLKNNKDAINLAWDFVQISQIWDDLYDQDKSVSGLDLNRMMLLALVNIPRNPFYRQHYQDIQPMVEHCLFNWLDSNWLEENGNNRDLQVSYILRSVTTDLIIHLAYLVGGADWRLQAAAEIRPLIYRDNESFTSYRKEIKETANVYRRR